MKTALVNEIHNADSVEWSVSIDGFNTADNSQTVVCANKEEAFKLKAIIDDLKEKMSWLCKTMEPVLTEQFDEALGVILFDIERIYL